MRRLTMTAERDRGAVAIVVAILLPIVFIGMAALTVDVGNISAERRQLQNGADAVALSVAMDCVRTSTCPVLAPDPEGLADGNAADGVTKIARVDGGSPVCGVGPGLTACTAVTPGLGECVQPSGPMPGKYVRVYTQTETKDGSTILPYFFAQAIVGDGSKGTTQQTCASAAWAAAADGTATVPVTMSVCEFNSFMAQEGTLVAPPPYPPYPGDPNTYEKVIYLHDTTGGAGICSPGPPNADFPGGFGWLAPNGPGCTVDVTADWFSGKTGNSVPCGNLDDFIGHVVYIPVYDSVVGTGAGGMYHLNGFVAFYLTQWTGPSHNGNKYPSTVTGKQYCTPGQTCLYGWFTSGLLPKGSFDPNPGVPDRGVSLIGLVG